MTNQTGLIDEESYNPPAFPVTPSYDEGVNMTYSGMGLRDYFAAKVLGGLMACPGDGSGMEDINEEYAQHAYRIADLMLKVRAK